MHVLLALAGSLAALAGLVGLVCYSPGQDHFGAITLDGNGTWYGNYVIKDQRILDTDVFFHHIGQSVDHARAADILFLGTSKVIFGLNWRVFDAFARDHQIKMFNMAFAGVMSERFSELLIHKWRLQPQLWVVDVYSGPTNPFDISFFNPAGQLGSFEAQSVARPARIAAYADVVITELRWRLKMALGLDGPASYRSDETGNWNNDRWPMYSLPSLPIMEKGMTGCPADPKEISAVREFVAEIGGDVVLTQVPSMNSCRQRVEEIADAIGVPFFAPDPAGYSTTDGGGHLDSRGSARYSREFFAWLETTDAFRRLVDAKQPAAVQ